MTPGAALCTPGHCSRWSLLCLYLLAICSFCSTQIIRHLLPPIFAVSTLSAPVLWVRLALSPPSLNSGESCWAYLVAHQMAARPVCSGRALLPRKVLQKGLFAPISLNAQGTCCWVAFHSITSFVSWTKTLELGQKGQVLFSSVLQARRIEESNKHLGPPFWSQGRVGRGGRTPGLLLPRAVPL